MQKPNFVVTQSCFITYIKVLDTSFFRRVSFGTLWELAKTKTDFHCKLSLPPFDSKFGKVAATGIMVQRFVFGRKQLRIAFKLCMSHHSPLARRLGKWNCVWSSSLEGFFWAFNLLSN